jgi:ABC-type phosphate/phosphonate transport system substrate-binding protein
MDLRWISKVRERIPLLLGCLLVLTLIASCGREEEPLPLDLETSPILAVDRPGSDGGVSFAVAPVISPDKSFASYRLFTKYLAARLKTPVQLIHSKTYLEVNEMLRNGSVHFALVCTGSLPYPATWARPNIIPSSSCGRRAPSGRSRTWRARGWP